jgi:hypothetical protein
MFLEADNPSTVDTPNRKKYLPGLTLHQPGPGIGRGIRQSGRRGCQFLNESKQFSYEPRLTAALPWDDEYGGSDCF